MIQKIPDLQDLWQCEMFGCYFFVLWGCGRGLQGPVEEHELAAVTLMRLWNKIERAELPLSSPPLVSCAAV